jgi:hypothetical protein
LYLALYGTKGSVIFDHPYNGGSARVITGTFAISASPADPRLDQHAAARLNIYASPSCTENARSCRVPRVKCAYPGERVWVALSSATIVRPGGASSAVRVWRAASSTWMRGGSGGTVW